MQLECLFEGGDQGAPRVALLDGGVAERFGGDGREPAGDLAAAGAGEQPDPFDVDAGVDERGGPRAMIILILRTWLFLGFLALTTAWSSEGTTSRPSPPSSRWPRPRPRRQAPGSPPRPPPRGKTVAS